MGSRVQRGPVIILSSTDNVSFVTGFLKISGSFFSIFMDSYRILIILSEQKSDFIPLCCSLIAL